MADQDARPLTDDERAELEALRAEKARRERAELESLRAEGARSSVSPSRGPRPAAPASARRTAPAPAAPVVPDDPEKRTFGQRMVLSSDEDEDGLPSMPPAQRIVIGVCLLLAVVVIAYVVLTNAGMI